jgi:hypothetical protein
MRVKELMGVGGYRILGYPVTVVDPEWLQEGEIGPKDDEVWLVDTSSYKIEGRISGLSLGVDDGVDEGCVGVGEG